MDKQPITEEGLEEAKMIEQKLTSVPTPSYPVGYCGCGLCFESPKYKEDCYFYGETHDMGAIIRFCTRGEIEWGHCPCEKCDQFLSKEEVDRVARSHIHYIQNDRCRMAEEQKASGAWKFVCYNPNYSPFDGSPSKLYECTNCGYTTGSTTKYCPVCGSKNQP